MEKTFGEYLLSSDKSLLSPERIQTFLSCSYWANERPTEVIKKSMDHSLCYGIYYHGEQVGFARVVTDYATMYWVCDVFVDEGHRGKSLGKELMRFILETEELKGLRGILATKDAHGMYEQFGFERVEGRFMRREIKKGAVAK